MAAFRFSDREWDKISAGLERHTGRLKYEGDREMLEMACDHFVQLRPRVGRHLPTPTKANVAWLKVAKAARRLDTAIAGLRPAGAADFTFLDDHKGGIADWAKALSEISQAAEWAAELEMHGLPVVSNNADPMRDGFVRELVSVWQGFGGKVTTGYDSHGETADGPLVRWLVAVSGPAMMKAGEPPMSADAIRAVVRNLDMAT